MRWPGTPAEPFPGSPLDRWLRPALFLPILLVASLAFSLWLARFGLPGADEGALLTNAVKLLRGAVYYRDIDAYPFPLATYMLAGWLAAFGEHLAVSRGLATLVYLVCVASLYRCALTLVGVRRAALFGVALIPLKYLAWPSFSAYAYWDVAFAFACITLALLLCDDVARRPLRLATAGVTAGLAILSKQNLGIYLTAAAGISLLFAVPLFGERRAPRAALWDACYFGAGVALPLAIAFGLFAWLGLLPHMLESGLIRPFTGYLPTSGIPFLEPLAWWELGSLRDHASVAYQFHRLWRLLFLGPLGDSAFADALWLAGEIFTRLLYSAVPIAFGAALWLWLRAHRSGRLAELSPLCRFALLAAAIFVSALPRADYSHVIAVYPVVLLLIYALWTHWVVRSGRATGRIELAGVALVSLLCAAVAIPDARWHAHRLQLARADTWVTPDDTWVESIVQLVDAETRPGDAIFVYGHQADLYFLTDRRSSWPFAQLYPGQTGEDGGRALVQLLRREQPKLVLRGLLSWPGLPPLAKEVPRLHQLLNQQWERVPDVFVRYPMPIGTEPEWWAISVLRPCQPERECSRFADFVKTQKFKFR